MMSMVFVALGASLGGASERLVPLNADYFLGRDPYNRTLVSNIRDLRSALDESIDTWLVLWSEPKYPTVLGLSNRFVDVVWRNDEATVVRSRLEIDENTLSGFKTTCCRLIEGARFDSLDEKMYVEMGRGTYLQIYHEREPGVVAAAEVPAREREPTEILTLVVVTALVVDDKRDELADAEGRKGVAALLGDFMLKTTELMAKESDSAQSE